MSEPKAGELSYRCLVCGATIRHAYPDLIAALDDAAVGTIRNPWHACDKSRVGVTKLLGGEYFEPQERES